VNGSVDSVLSGASIPAGSSTRILLGMHRDLTPSAQTNPFITKYDVDIPFRYCGCSCGFADLSIQVLDLSIVIGLAVFVFMRKRNGAR
jgi:hypothetical protein